MSSRMLSNFMCYDEPQLTTEQCIIGMPVGARLKQLVRLSDGWRVWIATHDYKHGTYLHLHADGMVIHVTVREDEGDEVFCVRPSDDTIRAA